MTEENWTKVESDVWNPEPGQEISGVYLSCKDEVGVNKSRLYTIEVSEGKTMGVWGSRILDDAMMAVGFGSQVKIKYNGKVKPEKGNEYKSYEVFTRPVSVTPVTETNAVSPSVAPTETIAPATQVPQQTVPAVPTA